jgi:WD40 repeat protein
MEPRRTPTAAAVAAGLVGVFALATIPVMLLREGNSSSAAHAADVTATTEALPIRMTIVSGGSVDPAPTSSVQLQGQTGPVLSLTISADETMMAGTDRAGNAHVWSHAGRLLATVTPASGLRISSVTFAPKDHEFVTVSSDGSVHFWPLPAAG